MENRQWKFKKNPLSILHCPLSKVFIHVNTKIIIFEGVVFIFDTKNKMKPHLSNKEVFSLSEDFLNKLKKHFFYLAFLSCCLLLFFYVRYRHVNIAFERDEGEYTYAAQEILRGKLPYKDFYNMKTPLVYYTLAFWFRLFGDSVHTVKIGLFFINIFSRFKQYIIWVKQWSFSRNDYGKGSN